MKKSLTLFAFVLGMSGAFAQDLTSKKGEPILPEQGDWGLGIDAHPFLEYAGNFFGKTTTNQAPTFNFLGPVYAITGRYFKDASTAYRASVRIGLGNVTERNMVNDRALATSTVINYPNNDAQKENVWKHSNNVIALSAGMEMRRGKTRLQGYYGAEAGIGFSSSRDKFEYGNTLNTSTTTPVGVAAADAFSTNSQGDVANNYLPSVTIGGQTTSARVLDRKNGSSFSFGLRGFIGVEYFMFAKVSLGGEFGWGLIMSNNGKTKTSLESQDFNQAGTLINGTTDIEGAKSGQWHLDTDNQNTLFGPAGTLRLNFYF